MKVLLIVLLGLVCFASCRKTVSTLPEITKTAMFSAWASRQEKVYSTEEFATRYEIFKANLKTIDEMNLKHPRADFGFSPFVDLSPAEFKKYYLGTPAPKVHDPSHPVAPLFSAKEISALPTSVDWRTKGAVTPVKNQGQCGSCWSFSTTGNTEGQHFLAGNKLVGLSEQNLVDCDHHCMIYEGQESCDSGCEGGLMPNAFQYIMGNGGIDSESSYPYEGVDGATCEFTKPNVAATLSNWTMISQDENQMAAYLYANGPISIAADAQEWQFYIGGVFEGPCGTSLDHGILIVGYGQEIDIFGFEIQFWIIKNSWGSDWGENGYLRVIRGVGECGVNLFACSGIINKN